MPSALTIQEKKERALARTEADRPQRKTRTPFGVPKFKLGVPMQIEGFHLHWINDTPGRVQEALSSGYQFVVPKEVGIPTEETQVKRLVGTQESGEPLYAYLMKIELDYYEEDQKELQRQVDMFDNLVRQGKLEQATNDKRYQPGTGIKISN